MVTLFGILNIGSSGVQASQGGLNTTGQNIANADTPGYSRQRVRQTSNFPLEVTPGSVGTGVLIRGIERFRDAFLEGQIRVQLSLRGYLGEQEQGFDNLQVLLNDPLNPVASSLENPAEAGLNFVLKQFFSAMHELSTTPESIAVRSTVVQTAVTLAETFNLIDRELVRLQTDVNARLALQTQEVNSITRQIAALNLRIGQVESDPRNSANDLRDQRDLLLRELSKKAPLQVFEDERGQVLVSILGVAVVNTGQSTDLLSRTVAGGSGLSDLFFDLPGSRVLTGDFDRGQIGGLLDVRDRVIPQLRRQLDTLAASLISEVNRVHSRGTGLRAYETASGLNAVLSDQLALNDAGLPFRVEPGRLVLRIENPARVKQTEVRIDIAAGDSLADVVVKLNAAGGGYVTAAMDANNRLEIRAQPGWRFAFQEDSSGLLTALGVNTLFTGATAETMGVRQEVREQLELLAASASGAPGDNRIALEIARLEQALTMAGGTATFAEFYRSTAAQVGVEANRVTQNRQNTDRLIQTLDNTQEQTAGVSLDEEAVNLIRFQQAFAAAARFITGTDELIDLVVNRLGLVGR